MKIRSVAAMTLLAFHFHAAAQQPMFSQAAVALPQLAYSACAWGDFDHDGDLDLALTGAEGNTPLTKIFRNDNGSFTDIQASLLPLHFGSVEWGDYDHDGQLDLLVTGIESQGTAHTILYKNTNGIFTDSGITLPGIMDGQATWGDLDNDGYPDILLAGSSMARIYKNTGNGDFININAPLPVVETTMCCWNDYNNDGQSDVLVCGNTGGGMVSKLYRNDHGVFTEVSISPEPLAGLYGGQARWADLDNDGDLDLAIAGMDLYVDGYLLFYRNDGNDHFTKFEGNSANLLNPSIDLGDYNNDGLTDIVVAGTIAGCGGPAATRLLKNLGSMIFTDVSSLLPGFKLGGVTWGDYNNDGYSDLLFTGLDVFEVAKTALYLNSLGDTTLYAPNTPPSPPQGTGAVTEPGRALLFWNRSSDGQTPANALSYNISIGTVPGSYEIFSPLAIVNTGVRLVSAPGNAGADTSWALTGILPGTYYFSVQAIDNGFMPGEFSAPQMFSFAPVGIDNHLRSEIFITPNPCRDRININNGRTAPGTGRTRIFNETGIGYYDGSCPGSMDVAAWPAGIYFVQFQTENEVFTGKFIKE